MGLKLVSQETGQNVSMGQFLLHHTIGYIINGIICYIGFLFVLFDARKQSLAQKLFGTFTVRAA